MSELEEILQAFGALVQEHEENTEVEEEDDEDTENFRCTDCVDCRTCRFCTSCERCSDCTYCDACSDCADCTQSRECLACAECSQSNLSAYCERSSYLTLCLDCDGCVQCFACVGLSDAEFCILNKPYKRGAYFKKVAELRVLLDAKLTEGWMPPWSTMTDAAAVDEPELSAPAIVAPAAVEVAREPVVVPEFEERAVIVAVTDAQRAILESPERTEPSSVELSVPPPGGETTAVLDAGDPPPILENTGSWPPVDHHSAREMDRGPRSPAPWEDLFAPDELPPPRVVKSVVASKSESPPRTTGEPSEAGSIVAEPVAAEPVVVEREPEAPQTPRRRETDRLPAADVENTGASRWSGSLPPRSRWDQDPKPASDKSRTAAPPPGFLGELPEPEPKPEPKRPSVRRVRRPDDS